MIHQNQQKVLKQKQAQMLLQNNLFNQQLYQHKQQQQRPQYVHVKFKDNKNNKISF